MFVLTSGTLQYTSHSGWESEVKPDRKHSSGSQLQNCDACLICEIALFAGWWTQGQMQASTACELFHVKAPHFWSFIRQFSQYARALKAYAETLLKLISANNFSGLTDIDIVIPHDQ